MLAAHSSLAGHGGLFFLAVPDITGTAPALRALGLECTRRRRPCPTPDDPHATVDLWHVPSDVADTPIDLTALLRRVLDEVPALRDRGVLALDPWGVDARHHDVEEDGLDHDLDLCRYALAQGRGPDFTLNLPDVGWVRDAAPGDPPVAYMYAALPYPLTR